VTVAGRGRILTLVGADGAGKSTQARRLCASLGGSARYIYMGSNPQAFTHALPTTKAWLQAKRALGREVHHSGPPEPGVTRPPERPVDRALRNLKSLAVFCLRISEDLHRLAVASIYARRGLVVVMDRHPYPDYYMRRVRETDEWLRWGDRLHAFLLRHVYPRPSNLVLLDAPAEILHARKPEGSLTAVEARRQEYLEMIRTLPPEAVTVLDVSRSEDAVAADLLDLAGSRTPVAGPG
jgi:thymidylate kinase